VTRWLLLFLLLLLLLSFTPPTSSNSDTTMVWFLSWWQSLCDHVEVMARPIHAPMNPKYVNPVTTEDDNLTSLQPPRQREDVIHVLQQTDWDCGIACLLMIWSWLAKYRPNLAEIDEERTSLLRMVDTESIWTIDLVYVLHKMEQRRRDRKTTTSPFDFLFCSSVFEANTEWKDYSYYSGAFERDQKRTQERLHHIQKERPSCLQHQKEPPSIDWVIEKLRETCTVAILLIDNATLASCMDSEPSCRHYAGHYLLLTGVCHKDPIEHQDDGTDPSSLQDNNDVFLIVFNPNSPRIGVEYILAHHVDEAWKAQGTDQDVIFVRKNGRLPRSAIY